MESLRPYLRPIVFGALTVLVFIFLIVAMSVETVKLTIGVSTFYYSVSASSSYSVFNSDLENAKCSGFPDIVRAPRAFLILAILGVLPCAVLVALDALKKTAVLGPVAPHFRFVMAGVAGYMAFCLIIAWPIMMAIPGKLQDCYSNMASMSISAKITAAPPIALVAWLMTCAMIAVAIFVPAPPQDTSAEETPAEAKVVTGVVVSTSAAEATTKTENVTNVLYAPKAV